MQMGKKDSWNRHARKTSVFSRGRSGERPAGHHHPKPQEHLQPGYLIQCSVAMKRHQDQGNPSKGKHLTEGLLAVSEI